MKRVSLYLLIGLFIMMISIIPTHAKEYKVNTLIPVDQVATVHTERFDYIDFSFLSKINEKGNGTIQFSSIHNNMVTKSFVSINIYLFDKNKINIGYLTYCSTKDYSSDYYRYEIQGGESTAFSINVTTKYFEQGMSAKDVYFIAVADENKYCRVGGNTLYVGKTIEQITNTEEEIEKENPWMNDIMKFLNSDIFMKGLIIFGVVVAFLILGALLNSLYRKMYTKGTFLVFIPIINIYITLKLVFGKIIAIIYFILLIASGVLFYFQMKIFLFVMLIIWGVSLLLVIVKLITQKYYLFYLEPSIDSSMYGTNFSKNVKNNNPNDLLDTDLETEEDSLLDDDSNFF